MKTIPEMDSRCKRRAVAPIIATLLMVAIAVVGGILIFVFAQGFFTDINVGAPTIELVEVFGYDARDTADLTFHTGNELTVSAASDGQLDEVDAFTIHIRNRGNTAVIIQKVKVYGASYQQATPATCSATVPAIGTFLMVDDDNMADTTAPILAALADCASSSFTVGANAEATIIMRYDEGLNGEQEVKIGRPIPIVIQTGNGGSFIKQLQNGVRL